VKSILLQNAESVEIENMPAQLRTFGCDESQGYLFVHPMPATDMERFLRERSGH